MDEQGERSESVGEVEAVGGGVGGYVGSGYITQLAILQAETRLLPDAEMQFTGTLRIAPVGPPGNAQVPEGVQVPENAQAAENAQAPGNVAATAAVTDVITISGELIGHHFYYDTVRGQGGLHHSPGGTVEIATIQSAQLNNGEVTVPVNITIPLPKIGTAGVSGKVGKSSKSSKASKSSKVGKSGSVRGTTWELQLSACLGQTTCSDPVSVWLGHPFQPQAWEGFLHNESIECSQLTPAVDLYHLTGRLPAGPIEMWLVVADLTDPRVAVESLHADQPFPEDTARWPRSTVSHMLTNTDGVAAINASLFEIKTTMNPRGMRIHAGKPLKSGNPGWQASIGFTAASVPYFGYWQWHGGVRRVDGEGYRQIATFSTTGTGADQLGLFGWPWSQSPGCDTGIGAAAPVVELVLTPIEKEQAQERGEGMISVPSGFSNTTQTIVAQVSEIRRQQPGIAIEQGKLVLSGFGAAADYLLETYHVGDQVEIVYYVTGDHAWPPITDWRQLNAVVSGNMALLRNGVYGDARVFSLPERHPHTAVGVTGDQSTLVWLIVDGRSERSIGMTYKELADFFLYIGALNALNCDGGGSTTLAIRDQESMQVKVINSPSDGEQRPAPDGLVIRWCESTS